jgi:hypothetical protein
MPPAPWNEECIAEADLGLETVCAEDLGVAASRVLIIGPNRGVKGYFLGASHHFLASDGGGTGTGTTVLVQMTTKFLLDVIVDCVANFGREEPEKFAACKLDE